MNKYVYTDITMRQIASIDKEVENMRKFPWYTPAEIEKKLADRRALKAQLAGGK